MSTFTLSQHADVYELHTGVERGDVVEAWKMLKLWLRRSTPIGILYARQQDDPDFIRHTQGLPTMPLNARAGASFTRQGPVWGTPPKPKKRRRGWLIALLILVMIGVIGVGLGGLFWFTHQSTPVLPKSQVVGHAFFVSSGQLDANGFPSLNDKLQINIQNIPPPAPGKSYYVWLLRDESQPFSTPIALGQLTIAKGTASIAYQGDAQHTNLLTFISRILITEEDATTSPVSPSSDVRYVAELPQAPDPRDTANHFSMLDHLRFLLVQDPRLTQARFKGGLDIWFLRNTGKVTEWAYSARGFWGVDVNSMRQHFIRILDYLDGVAYVQQDVPASTPLAVPAPIGLLGSTTPDPQQPVPLDYLHLINAHLSAMAQAPGTASENQQLIARIRASLNSVGDRLEKVHQDAKQLFSMSDTQLFSQNALTILNDMMAQAFYAYTGQFDLSTNQMQGGAVQIHNDIEHLATFDITPYKP